MVTYQQINDIHERLGKVETLAEYANALLEIGIVRYDTFVSDGHSEFFTKDGQSVFSPVYHEAFAVADIVDKADFQKTMKLTEDGMLGYEAMSKALAECGVEKWSMDTQSVTLAYTDKAGTELLVEKLS